MCPVSPTGHSRSPTTRPPRLYSDRPTPTQHTVTGECYGSDTQPVAFTRHLQSATLTLKLSGISCRPAVSSLRIDLFLLFLFLLLLLLPLLLPLFSLFFLFSYSLGCTCSCFPTTTDSRISLRPDQPEFLHCRSSHRCSSFTSPPPATPPTPPRLRRRRCCRCSHRSHTCA